MSSLAQSWCREHGYGGGPGVRSRAVSSRCGASPRSPRCVSFRRCWVGRGCRSTSGKSASWCAAVTVVAAKVRPSRSGPSMFQVKKAERARRGLLGVGRSRAESGKLGPSQLVDILRDSAQTRPNLDKRASGLDRPRRRAQGHRASAQEERAHAGVACARSPRAGARKTPRAPRAPRAPHAPRTQQADRQSGTCVTTLGDLQRQG